MGCPPPEPSEDADQLGSIKKSFQSGYFLDECTLKLRYRLFGVAGSSEKAIRVTERHKVQSISIGIGKQKYPFPESADHR